MKQSCVRAFARAARSFALAAVALGFGAGSLLAQGSTGKIEGRVRDQAGAPIANAQVFIVGTAFNALTNPQGYYFFNNVPAGTYAVRAAFIGYKSTQVDGVKVLGGQTITVDIQLEQTAVQIEEITVVTQTQPLVPRDEVTTKQRVDGKFTSKLPVDRINAVLALQPGVAASTSGNTLSIRGGRPDENATYIDGVPVTAGTRGNYTTSAASNFGRNATSEVTPGTGAFEEASITTGSSSAEFGNAQSGIVSIVTRTGGTNFTGSLGYTTDEPFGKSHGLGYNRVEGSLGGPLPVQGLTFFASGALEGQQATGNDFSVIGDAGTGGILNAQGFDAEKAPVWVAAGLDTTVAVPTSLTDPTADTTFVSIPRFALYRGDCDAFSNAGATGRAGGVGAAAVEGIQSNYGFDCQGIRLPVSGQGFYSVTGKLNYSYGTGSRIALSALRSQTLTRIFDYFSLYNGTDLEGRKLASNYLTLNWTQNLSRSSERALALETYLSYQSDRSNRGVLTPESEVSTRDKFGGFLIGGMDFLFDEDNFPINEELITNMRKDSGRRAPVPFNDNNYNPVRQFRTNPYASLGADQIILQRWEESGGPLAVQGQYRENRWLGKANLDWQFDRYNRLKLGGEYTHYDISSYSQTLTSQAFPDAWLGEPVRWNVFAEDRLDLGDVVVVGGLRYDRFASKALRPFYVNTAGDTVSFPRISSMPGFDPLNPTANLREDPAHDYLSPHVQVSFPVTDRTNFRFSYAHQVQAPDFGLVYGGINTDLAITNANQLFGTDLDFGRTITYEFGVRHAFSDDMVLDVALYNKDNLANPAGRIVPSFDPGTGNPNTEVAFVQNVDFGNTRGLDLRLDRRFGNLFNGTVSYSYQQAQSTGSDPLSTTAGRARLLGGLGGGRFGPPQAILPTDFSRPHTLAGAMSLTFPENWEQGSTVGSILENFSIFTTFRFASGTPFTRCEPGREGNPSQSREILSGGNCLGNEISGTFSGARLPSFKQLDMRFNKGFGLGGLDLTAYLDIRNLLNFRNILEVFTVTNNITNQEDRDRFLSRELSDFADEATTNNALRADSAIVLTGPTVCRTWVDTGSAPAAPNCVYLIRAEQRFGNGDGVYDPGEQRNALAYLYEWARGEHRFTGPPRRARLGIELSF
ncbi:MAG TPA: carboxypeptidase regulatory-like domain-containing protein [Gemmatimonadales bacterium]|nr:carboxypeptidase regulatory-like domain-containing protein [Gemmatimonadales bacterium]